jgi:riboflavin kinase/FMN adenylyltransferase
MMPDISMMPCIITGEIVHGKHLGRTVGMPTANLKMDASTLTIPLGVYASHITVRGVTYIGLTNIGTRPTVDDDASVTVETHILDFDADIYGEIVSLEVRHFIRAIRKFDSLEAVKQQVQRDIVDAKRYFSAIQR